MAGKVITKEVLKAIVTDIKHCDADLDYMKVRSIVNPRINLNDFIPAEYATLTLNIVRRMYNPKDFGWKGKHEESKDRVYNMIDCNNAELIVFREFFAHEHKDTDIYDKSIHTGFEKKTSVGNWLYYPSDDFDECIKMYSRKRTMIRWDYTREEFGIDIHIETTYKKLFEYLIAYNPKKGLSTWFKLSSRSKNGIGNKYVWDMQDIRNSQKKIDYLMNWKG